MSDIPIWLERAIVDTNDINAVFRHCRLNNIRFRKRPGVVVVLS